MLKRILGLLAGAALLFWLFSDNRWEGLAAALASLPPEAIVLTLVGLWASYALRAIRIYEEFRTDSGQRFWPCLRIVLIHNALVNVLPFRSGEAAFPALLRQQFGTPLPRALASLFWFRLQDAWVVALLATLVWPNLAIGLRLLGIFLLLACAWALPRWAQSAPAANTVSTPPSPLSKLRSALGESTQHARFGWIWTLANWSVKLTVQAALLATLLGQSFPVGASGALGAELAAILPIQGVAGFGTYEAGAAAAMRTHGVTLEAGLQAALALHLLVIASAVFAGALAWFIPARPQSTA